MVNLKQSQNGVSSLPNNLEACQAELLESRREIEELKDRFLQAAAQIENIRKWTERDIQARSKEDQRKLLRQFLDVLDNLERALAGPSETSTLYEGIKLTFRQLEQVLTQAGVERMRVEPSDLFDPLYHESIEVRSGNVDEPIVAEIVQPGYLYHDDLLRPAGVVVLRPLE